MKGFYIKRIKRLTRDVKKKNVKKNSKKNFNNPSALMFDIYIF